MIPNKILISKSTFKTIVFCTIIFGISVGATSREEVGQEKKSIAGDNNSSSPSTENLTAEQISQLEALGYLSGYVPPREQLNVTIYDKERAYDGLNFFSSADKPSAYLMDMYGNILHEWYCEIHEVWPEKNFDGIQHTHFWRRVYLYPNGDILAIFENIGIIKLDKDSNVIWRRDNRAHHDLEVLDNGDIWVLTNKLNSISRITDEVPVQEDFLTLMDKNGNIKREISILSSIENSRFQRFMQGQLKVKNKSKKPVFDIFHSNSLEVLDGSVEHIRPEFKKGNILTSFRSLHLIAVIDLEKELAVWAFQDKFMAQHDPKILENGNLLLFDNFGRGEKSTVLEFDLGTMNIVWSYSGTEESPFYSIGSGASERFPNGNTLITETREGRAFEVTESGEIVWEFYNPNKTGKNKELIATIPELIRVKKLESLEWLWGSIDRR